MHTGTETKKVFFAIENCIEADPHQQLVSFQRAASAVVHYAEAIRPIENPAKQRAF